MPDKKTAQIVQHYIKDILAGRRICPVCNETLFQATEHAYDIMLICDSCGLNGDFEIPGRRSKGSFPAADVQHELFKLWLEEQ